MKLGATIPTSPLVYADGNIRPEWRAFFNGLWLRTGGAVGMSSDTSVLEAELAAETAARKQGDSQLGQAISQGDTGLTRLVQQEAQARQDADALLVPIAQQCTLWSQCNLTFLPTSDPGHGQPWLNGGVVTVGTPPAAMVGIGLEDATGDWTLPDGTGHFLFG